MAGSLFRNYPYDVPTEAFSLNLFRQVRADLECSGTSVRLHSAAWMLLVC